MAKYGRAASKRVESAVSRTKKGTLKSGSGRKVTSRKQAIAIGLSEARKEGGKVPARKGARKTGRKTARKTSRKTAGKSTSRTSARKTSRKSARKSSGGTKRSRAKS
jgi:hypothetical protein